MRDHRSLKAYQVAHELVIQVYALTEHFPSSERYGLSGQMRRAAVSIVANIAEGSGRETSREYRRFLVISLASARELEAMLMLVGDLGLADSTELDGVQQTHAEAARLLAGLIRAKGAHD